MNPENRGNAPSQEEVAEKAREDFIRATLIGPYRKPAFERPECWPRLKLETLTPNEKASELMLDLHLKATPILFNMSDHGVGKKDFREGRKEEKTDIEIDEAADLLIKDALKDLNKRYKMSFFVLSEHTSYKIGKGEPAFCIAVDPYDNSDEYQRGIDTPGHLVLSIYELDGNPITAGDSNLVNQHIFINRDGKNYEYNPRTKEFKNIPPPEPLTTIKDPKFSIASYFGRDKYSRPFIANFDSLMKERHPRSSLHTKGGSHIYGGGGLMSGAISTYIMFGEPVSEIAPGLPFIIPTGLIAISVDENGNYSRYKFNPRKYIDNPNSYREDRINFFIAIPPSLLPEVLRYAFQK